MDGPVTTTDASSPVKRLVFLLPVAAFLAIAAAFLYDLGRDTSILPSALIGEPVPGFELPPLKPETPGLATGDLNGRTALVNVFASWCGPCRVEHPILMRLAADGIPVYGINYKDARTDALGWLARLGDPYGRIGADRDGRVAIEWGVYGVPETFVVDSAGRIRYRHVGPIMPQHLDEIFRPLLEELGESVPGQ